MIFFKQKSHLFGSHQASAQRSCSPLNFRSRIYTEQIFGRFNEIFIPFISHALLFVWFFHSFFAFVPLIRSFCVIPRVIRPVRFDFRIIYPQWCFMQAVGFYDDVIGSDFGITVPLCSRGADVKTSGNYGRKHVLTHFLKCHNVNVSCARRHGDTQIKFALVFIMLWGESTCDWRIPLTMCHQSVALISLILAWTNYLRKQPCCRWSYWYSMTLKGRHCLPREWIQYTVNTEGLAQNCSNCSALAMELL